MQLDSLVDFARIAEQAEEWPQAQPFPHLVIDGFFTEETARALEAEFPDFGESLWHSYSNRIEQKKTCNIWNAFPPLTYGIFTLLNSPDFVDRLSQLLLQGRPLYPDPGLNGGGWHAHAKGGKLNTHLDYSLHPKLGLQRKLNLIVYLNSNWKAEWGGHLGLWSNESAETPGELVKQVAPLFNRAILFDTTENSWHGLPEPIVCPDNEVRKSLAVYYLCEPDGNVDERGKAKFAPYKDQAKDPEVLELIRKRSDTKLSRQVYRDGN